MRVLIITGGTSSERKISFMSAKQVKEGLKEAGYQVKLFDLKKGKKELKKLSKNFEIIFPVIHGEEGEGGDLQKFLQSLGKPFMGGDWRGYKKGWHKIPFKKFCDENKILTAPWKIVKTKEDIKKYGFPSVLKGSSGGSSHEVAILKSEKDIDSSFVKNMLSAGYKLLIEKYLPGVEITVAVLGKRALPVIEIVPPEAGWFDYKNKYWGETKEIPFAPSVSGKFQEDAQQIAENIHNTLKLGQFSRTDFIVSEGKIYVLEVNTIPGLTASSLLPKAALAAGLSFPKLLDKIIKMIKNPLLKEALKRYN